jgi:hypothetical protein
VDHPALVRGVHAAAQPDDGLDGVRGRELPSALQSLAHRLGLDVLHHQVGDAAVEQPAVVDVDDRRMPERREDARLAEQHFARFVALDADELERDAAVEQ